MSEATDRRRHRRRAIKTPVSVSTSQRGDRAGVIRDVSATGMLFHSKSQYEVGETVSLMFDLTDRRPILAGKVVRTFVDDNLDHFFQHVTAVRFDKPIAELE